MLAARARSQREDSASGGSGRARSASRRARSASRGVSEGTTAGGGSSANDDEASWDGDDGGKDDEFVVPRDGKRMAKLFEDYTYLNVENMGYAVPNSKFASSSYTPSATTNIAKWIFEKFPMSDSPYEFSHMHNNLAGN